MKFTERIGTVYRNFQALLSGDITPINTRQLQNMMMEQFGAGWMDRIMAVRGRLKPETVERIINEASSRTSGKLGQLYELMYYIQSDGRIGGMLDKRVGAVGRVLWEVHAGNKDNTTSTDAAHFLNRYLEDIRFKGFLKQAMDGKLYGVTAFQNVVQDVGSHYVFKDPTEHQLSQSRWYQERSGDSNWGKLYIKSADGDKLFIDNENHVHPARLSTFINRHKKGYYDTTGIMVRVMRMYVLKVWTLVFLSQLVERHGKPFIYTNLSDNEFKDPEFKATVARILKQFGAERWGVFPEGLEIESLDTSSAAASGMHETLLNFANVEMAVAILGQNLSTEVQGGSFAAAVSHADVEEDLTVEDIEWLEEQVNDHFLYYLTQINYPGLQVDEYPKISITPRKNVDIEKVSRGFKSLTELVDVPKEEIYVATQVRAPRMKENDDGEQQEYDEEVVGPSTRNRARNLDALINNLGA